MNTDANLRGKENYCNSFSQTAKNGLNPPLLRDNREVWKPFPALEDRFEISSLGRVRNAKTHAPIRTYLNKGFEMLYTRVRKGGKTIRSTIHRAVALAFVPNPNNYLWAVAIDKTKPLTHASNLQWAEKQFSGGRGKWAAQHRLTVRESLSFKKIRYPNLPNPVCEDYGEYLMGRLYCEGRISLSEYKLAGVVTAQDDSMSPTIPYDVQFIATPVNRADYATLVGKVVAVVVKAKRFAYYLGRVKSISDTEVCVSRDNSEWSERTESREVIASIAKILSIIEAPVS